MRILDACSWNKKEAARILEISRGTLYRKILEFGLEPPDYPARRYVQAGDPRHVGVSVSYTFW